VAKSLDPTRLKAGNLHRLRFTNLLRSRCGVVLPIADNIRVVTDIACNRWKPKAESSDIQCTRQIACLRSSRGRKVDISAWLTGLGLERYEAAFLEAEVTFDMDMKIGLSLLKNIFGLGIGL
jgi:hypothetical protein